MLEGCPSQHLVFVPSQPVNPHVNLVEFVLKLLSPAPSKDHVVSCDLSDLTGQDGKTWQDKLEMGQLPQVPHERTAGAAERPRAATHH